MAFFCRNSRARISSWIKLGMLLFFAGIAISLAAPVPSGKPSAFPSWWFARELIERSNPAEASPEWPADYPASDDFAVANQGQLKHLASKAHAELEWVLPSLVWGEAGGETLAAMIDGWTGSSTADNYAAANQGQLKTVAKAFYDVLGFPEVGYVAGLGLAPAAWTTGTYPWSSSTGDDDNHAAVNIGQVKYLFSFDPDSDGDRLADSWELQIINANGGDAIDSLDDVNPGDDFDSDTWSNREEYVQATDATDDGDYPVETADSGQVQLEIFTPLLEN